MTQATKTPLWNRMSRSAKTAAIVLPLCAALILIVVLSLGKAAAPERTVPSEASTTAAPSLIEANTHVLDRVDGDAPEFVEFLDFECEACGGVYPFIEQVREQYRGEIRYAVRYFNTKHSNSMNAALAAQAAAEQGKFEAMYHLLFDRQASWGEQRTSQAPLFRSYAEELGLDLAKYDQAVQAPDTRARIEFDHNAGIALGIQGTPSFFLDGKLLSPQTREDVTKAIDASIAAHGGK